MTANIITLTRIALTIKFTLSVGAISESRQKAVIVRNRSSLGQLENVKLSNFYYAFLKSITVCRYSSGRPISNRRPFTT